MYRFAQKLFVFVFVLTSAFVLTSVFHSKEVCAVSTRCCKVVTNSTSPICDRTASTDCGACREGFEYKNPLSCGDPADNCNGAANCGNCSTGEVSITCDGGGGILCTAAFSPNPVNLAVGETKRLSVNVKSYSTALGFTRLIMGNTATAIFTGTTSPTNGDVATNRVKWNTCCGFAQTTKTFSVDIKGVAAGTSTITSDAQHDDSTTPKVCATTSVVVGGAAVLSCKPGAKCVSNTGVFKSGAYVTCSMPVLTSTELGGKTPSYEVACTPYNGTTAQAVIAKKSSNGTFASFGIASGNTTIKCSFRYCLISSAGTTCSVWGTL